MNTSIHEVCLAWVVVATPEPTTISSCRDFDPKGRITLTRKLWGLLWGPPVHFRQC